MVSFLISVYARGIESLKTYMNSDRKLFATLLKLF
jgi:hypothetical protein